MTATLSPTVARHPLSDAQIAQFRRDGYVAARQLFTQQEIAEIRDTFMEANKNGPVEGLSEIKRDDNGGGYQPSDPLSFYPRMMHPHNHPDKPVGKVANKYMLHARLESILAALFEEEPIAVQSMFYFKPPGARGQSLHQDNFYLRAKPGTCMAAWVAIDDADEENGGMACVPNTQSYPIQCPEKSNAKESFTSEYVAPPEGFKPELVKLKAGDVLFFNGNVIHGSGPNRSATRFRRAFICHYVPLSTAEMSHWYTTKFRFNGEPLSIAVNNEGGPCGTVGDVAGPH